MTPSAPTVNAHAEQEIPKLLLSVEEAAETLTIGRTMMFALIKEGNVETVQIGKRRLVPYDSLRTFVTGLRGVTFGES